MTLTVVTIALVSNHLLGWNYDANTEDHIPRQDTVVVPASHRYSNMSPIKWFFLGKNYREEWSTPVSMPVFHLSTTKGGFSIEKLGGGEQTKSLHLVNRDGTKWVLRSVDKNVRDALPQALRGTFVQNIVQDQISAAYPYAVLTIFDLAKAVNIPSPTTELYYIPDDPALGKFRPIFAHTACFLSPKNIDGQKIDTEPTDTVRHMLDSSSHFQLQQEKVLTARLFDMFIADWDRHKGQWDWGFADSGYTRFIYPVPEDRDQAYFLSRGAIAKVVTLFGMPHLIGFREDPKNLKKLNHKVHNFDRYYLNQLGKSDWERTIRSFQSLMTDHVIQKAVSRLPKQVYAISGEEIKRKLIGRRNGLLKAGLDYYDFIAQNVAVHSTVEPEIFVVTGNNNQVSIEVKRQFDGRRIFHRTFYAEETSVVTISGIRNDDQVKETGKSSIKVQVLREGS